MDNILKREWLKALRSGKYKQGRSILRTQYDEYCCLGVLCDVANKLSGLGEWKNVDDGFGAPAWRFISAVDRDASSSRVVPNTNLYDAFGLDHELAGRLATMNDSGKSFVQIARTIKAKA
jgi:hypothetical protein